MESNRYTEGGKKEMTKGRKEQSPPSSSHHENMSERKHALVSKHLP